MQKENQGRKSMVISVEKLLEVCGDASPARKLDPRDWKPTLPRIRWETGKEDWDWKKETTGRWVAECWWRSSVSGSLCYYAKRDLTTLQLREFRELPPAAQDPGVSNPKKELSYLRRALEAIHSPNPGPELSEKLDAHWVRIAPPDTQKLGASPRPKYFLVSREAVEQWDWEKLRDLILKRENKTAEEILEIIHGRDE